MVTKIGHNSKKVPHRHFIKAWREKRGLTQEQLSLRIADAEGKDGMDHSQLSKIETGKTKLSEQRLYAIADSLNVEIGLLFVHPEVAERQQFVSKIIADKSDDQIRTIFTAIEALSKTG